MDVPAPAAYVGGKYVYGCDVMFRSVVQFAIVCVCTFDTQKINSSSTSNSETVQSRHQSACSGCCHDDDLRSST